MSGTLSISEVKLPLKDEFLRQMRRHGEPPKETYWFMVVVRSGASLSHTVLGSSDEAVSEGSICFDDPTELVCEDLQENSRVSVEVHGVVSSFLYI